MSKFIIYTHRLACHQSSNLASIFTNTYIIPVNSRKISNSGHTSGIERYTRDSDAHARRIFERREGVAIFPDWLRSKAYRLVFYLESIRHRPDEDILTTRRERRKRKSCGRKTRKAAGRMSTRLKYLRLQEQRDPTVNRRPCLLCSVIYLSTILLSLIYNMIYDK